MEICAISGSLREQSFNTKLLRAAARLAGDTMTIEVIRLNDIPLYNGDDDTPDTQPQAVLDLAARLRTADGLVISTPEYNYSISGVLKNTIDWLSRVKGQPFNGKPVGILGAAAGQIGSARAQYHLRQVLVGLNPRVMNRPEFFMSAAHTRFDDQGNLTDTDSETFLQTYVTAFEKWVNDQSPR